MGYNSTSRLVSRFTGNSLLPVLPAEVIQEVQVLPASLISKKEKKENHATTQDPRPTTLAATDNHRQVLKQGTDKVYVRTKSLCGKALQQRTKNKNCLFLLEDL